MNFNLEKIFASVIDFFAILLPGSMVVYFFERRLGTFFFSEEGLFPAVPEKYNWAVFAVTAYIVGHFVNALGSAILDKYYYDKFERQKHVRNFDLTYLAAAEIRDKYLSAPELRARHFEKGGSFYDRYTAYYNKQKELLDAETSTKKVVASKHSGNEQERKMIMNCKDIKEHVMANHRIECINTYQWAKRIFCLHQPEALSEVNRLEADQKFFRSLVVASFILFTWLLATAFYHSSFNRGLTSLIFLAISYFSLKQYSKYRFKNTELAYQFLIAMHYGPEKKKTEKVKEDDTSTA